MIDLISLIKNTGAYRIMKSDKANDKLSHAYLILTSDERMLIEYLKIFAKLLCCDEIEPCNQCRACKMIDEKTHPDVMFFPKNEGQVLSEDVNDLIEESYIRPIEGHKKVFVVSNAESMNASAQNKLLKTLEEPPKNVHIILGATSEFPLLSTIKSRTKKLSIPEFDKKTLMEFLSTECEDKERLKMAISCGNGTIGKALDLYHDKDNEELVRFTMDMLINMNSSKDVLKYSTLLMQKKAELSQFLSILELLLRDLLVVSQGQKSLVNNDYIIDELIKVQKFNSGAILYALDKIQEAQKRKKFNMNPTMLVEWLLFQILEGKFKWQKF